MSFPLQTRYATADSDLTSDTLPALMQLPRPLLGYRIVIAIVKGDVGAVNILKDTLRISRQLKIHHTLLALGPTTPETLQAPNGSRILWATFTDGANLASPSHLTIVPPNDLTDLSLSIEKLSKTRAGRIPLLLGDFLDNVLSVSTSPAGLYAFLCKLFTRIRTNHQTAFFLATEDMHDPKKLAILKRFADVVIEYRSESENGTHALAARILDHTENHYSVWDGSQTRSETIEHLAFLSDHLPENGRQHNLPVQRAIPFGR